MEGRYKVNEIFYSLQGEGYWSGTPCVFLRLSICNLRCPFCDTSFGDYALMGVDEILKEISEVSSIADKAPGMVVITGGEPTLQLDSELLGALHGAGLRVHLETNGTIPPPQGIDWITLSPKEDFLGDKAKVAIPRADELKLVFEKPQDVAKWLDFPADHYFLQPRSGENTGEVVSYILSHPRWRLSLQTHKYLGIR